MTTIISIALSGGLWSEVETSRVVEKGDTLEEVKPEVKVEAKTEIEEGAKSKGETEPEILTEKAAEALEEARDKEKKEPSEPVERQVFGWKEWVKVGTKADVMRAKLDSGARTSSLHAEGIEEFERDGREWVRFTMRDPDEKDSKSILIKAPVQRVAKVKNTDGTMERRFVVELGFSMGDRQLREEFNLNDRTGMTCPVLIGRNALRHLGYVDCSRVDLATKKILK
ncbi:MAG: ATP-dependent zinc protease family protein [Roseibacillus sp.]